LIDAARLLDIDRPVDLPDVATAWGILGSTDTYRKLAPHWPACRDDMTPTVQLTMENADLLNRRRQARAVGERIALEHALSDLFEDVDLLITPTTATTALGAEGPYPEEIAGTRVRPMGSLPFTYPFNMSGHPAISLPAGRDADGLPVGMQIVGRHHDDHLVLAAAAAFEAARPWPRFAPYAENLA
jgi:Asp-tRNA(Asn)/Glu-tRNA(Gln) amidotransferase A subunit family amidase